MVIEGEQIGNLVENNQTAPNYQNEENWKVY